MQKTKILNATVIIAALGYFVDIFDLILFGMVRIPSLTDLGFTPDLVKNFGLIIDNWQMGGMLVGGFLWGIIGDKKGRLTVLFGSILTYSIANIANGFIQPGWGFFPVEHQYALCRFIAGIGLAGELGAGVTLVNEIMVKEKRGLATAFVAATGILGAVVGGFVVKYIPDWRMAYFIGGGMGLVLLLLRMGVTESEFFKNAKKQPHQMGDILILIKDKKLFLRYISIILIAVPIWYVVQLYAKYSPELLTSIGISLSPSLKKEVALNAIMIIYFGLTLGDLASGFTSYFAKSRLKAIRVFLFGMLGAIGLFWMVDKSNLLCFYLSVMFIGFFAGYWAVFMSVAAESFGTNIRSTVTNTAPNLVRGSVIGINFLFAFFSEKMGWGDIYGNLIVGAIVFSLALFAYRNLQETYHKDLDYSESS